MVPLKMNKNSLKNIATEVIDLEINALKILKKSINKNFDRAVNLIVDCQSKIIFCGVGKSGLIAAKIASTFSSAGSPAFSLSANDCLHGDLGSITKKDVLILISNSGKSEEIIPIIKFANRNKIKLIGIFSKKTHFFTKLQILKFYYQKLKNLDLEWYQLQVQAFN